MVLKIIWMMIMVGAGISINGCAFQRAEPGVEAKAQTFAENYRRSKKTRCEGEENVKPVELTTPSAIGYVKSYVPVVVPPRVLKVWVPAHVAAQDKKVLVSGHWSFVMIKEADWYIESEQANGLSMPVVVPRVMEKEK